MSKYSALNITGVLASLLWAQGAAGADLFYSPELIEDQDLGLTLPAVSAPNGKLELYGGLTNPGTAGFRVGGSFSLPVGDAFGVQLDGSIVATGAGASFGGAVHAFTRDPQSYLVGITGAAVRGPAGTLGVIGVEAEAYLDRWSIEAWGGVGGLNYDDPALADLAGVFLLADAAFYPTDDFRLLAGVSHLLGENGLHFGAEYLLRDQLSMPVSLTADVRVTQTGAYSVMGGIKGYFGGDDSGKSLIDRHRQDDPPNRALSLFLASGSLLYATAPAPATGPTCAEDEKVYEGQCAPSDPEEFACWQNGGTWIDGESCVPND